MQEKRTPAKEFLAKPEHACYNIRWGERLQSTTPLMWLKCPECGSKLLPIREDTTIKNLAYKCKHCKKISLISLEPIRAEK